MKTALRVAILVVLSPIIASTAFVLLMCFLLDFAIHGEKSWSLGRWFSHLRHFKN